MLYPAFATGTLEVAFGLWPFLYLIVRNFPQLHMHAVFLGPDSFFVFRCWRRWSPRCKPEATAAKGPSMPHKQEIGGTEGLLYPQSHAGSELGSSIPLPSAQLHNLKAPRPKVTKNFKTAAEGRREQTPRVTRGKRHACPAPTSSAAPHSRTALSTPAALACQEPGLLPPLLQPPGLAQGSPEAPGVWRSGLGSTCARGSTSPSVH